jgi:hypothetical protein
MEIHDDLYAPVASPLEQDPLYQMVEVWVMQNTFYICQEPTPSSYSSVITPYASHCTDPLSQLPVLRNVVKITVKLIGILFIATYISNVTGGKSSRMNRKSFGLSGCEPFPNIIMTFGHTQGDISRRHIQSCV